MQPRLYKVNCTWAACCGSPSCVGPGRSEVQDQRASLQQMKGLVCLHISLNMSCLITILPVVHQLTYIVLVQHKAKRAVGCK